MEQSSSLQSTCLSHESRGDAPCPLQPSLRHSGILAQALPPSMAASLCTLGPGACLPCQVRSGERQLWACDKDGVRLCKHEACSPGRASGVGPCSLLCCGAFEMGEVGGDWLIPQVLLTQRPCSAKPWAPPWVQRRDPEDDLEGPAGSDTNELVQLVPPLSQVAQLSEQKSWPPASPLTAIRPRRLRNPSASPLSPRHTALACTVGRGPRQACRARRGCHSPTWPSDTKIQPQDSLGTLLMDV